MQIWRKSLKKNPRPLRKQFRTSHSLSSVAVFFKKVGCHDTPLLPILSQSHEVFVSHSRPFCDICHPIRSWPSSAYFPLQWTIQYQPVDVVLSDHVTEVGHCYFLYCWNYVKVIVWLFWDFFISSFLITNE